MVYLKFGKFEYEEFVAYVKEGATDGSEIFSGGGFER